MVFLSHIPELFLNSLQVSLHFFIFLYFSSVIYWKFITWYKCFFLFIITRSGLPAGIRTSIFISKLQGVLWVLFPSIVSHLGMCHLPIQSSFNCLHSFQQINFPIQSCLLLYSCSNFPHSLIMWFTVLFLFSTLSILETILGPIYYSFYLVFLMIFSIKLHLMVFTGVWVAINPHFSLTLLSILADFSNAVM